jgi:hypothetical protein
MDVNIKMTSLLSTFLMEKLGNLTVVVRALNKIQETVHVDISEIFTEIKYKYSVVQGRVVCR